MVQGCTGHELRLSFKTLYPGKKLWATDVKHKTQTGALYSFFGRPISPSYAQCCREGPAHILGYPQWVLSTLLASGAQRGIFWGGESSGGRAGPAGLRSIASLFLGLRRQWAISQLSLDSAKPRHLPDLAECLLGRAQCQYVCV